jgi:kinesin family member 11
MEETLSTLDYAYRAKNIRNKPEVNQVVSNKTMFKDLNKRLAQLEDELRAC